LSTINSSSTSVRYETRGCASRSSGKSVVATDSSSLILASRCARDGRKSEPFASRARYASRRSTALMRRKVGVSMNCRPIFNPTINDIARRAGLTSRTQKYDTRPKMDEIEPKNDEESVFGDLDCCEVACQVLPHLV
jgi:hypothetical protein